MTLRGRTIKRVNIKNWTNEWRGDSNKAWIKFYWCLFMQWEKRVWQSDSPCEELSVEEKKVKDFFKMVLPWCVGGVFLIGMHFYTSVIKFSSVAHNHHLVHFAHLSLSCYRYIIDTVQIYIFFIIIFFMFHILFLLHVVYFLYGFVFICVTFACSYFLLSAELICLFHFCYFVRITDASLFKTNSLFG